MTYRTILVSGRDGKGAEARINLALGLGRLFNGATMGVGDDGGIFLGLAAEGRYVALWASETAPPLEALVRRARCADLIVATRPADRNEQADPAGLVFETGAPVLLAPAGVDRFYPRTAVIGWKNTRSTRRAITDALPLLRVAERVLLVGLAEDDAPPPDRREMEAAADRLGRHGMGCEVLTPLRIGGTTADELVATAECWSADLLIAGAFARSPWREGLFGGVTRDLLSAAPLPVLFSR